MHDKVDPSFMKTHVLHNFFNETPFDPIIGLTHVKLDRHVVILPILFMIKIVQYLKGDQHIIGYKVLREKSTLAF